MSAEANGLLVLAVLLPFVGMMCGLLLGGRGEGGAGSGEGRSAVKIACDQTRGGGGAGADGDCENAGQKKRAAEKLRRP
jgi:hypothetical protein